MQTFIRYGYNLDDSKINNISTDQIKLSNYKYLPMSSNINQSKFITKAEYLRNNIDKQIKKAERIKKRNTKAVRIQ